MIALSDQQILDTDLIESMGLAGATDDACARVVNNIVTLVLKTAMLKILDTLPEEKKKELARVIEQHGAESQEVTDFLQNNVTNLAEILEEALVSVKRGLINRTQEK